MKNLNINEITNAYPSIDHEKIEKVWSKIRPSLKHKIIVLDDDPTGVQTVHGVSVYTDWTEETIEGGFLEESQMFFILTNSRAFTAEETEHVHRDIAVRVERISQKLNTPYLMISRGDSTLRGHYPLETEVIGESIERETGFKVDGEVITPFFKEGGRLTVNNIHYVQQGNELVPAGQTEFAGDRTFGYRSSHLGEWVEEKTGGRYCQDKVTYISLESIRNFETEKIADQLLEVTDFNKVVVNALEEADIKVFSIALINALNKGKSFIFRTAAAFTKIIGDISSRPLLTREELVGDNPDFGGLIIVGSHVKKTTEQLNELKALSTIHFIELDSHLVLNKEVFLQEVNRAKTEAEEYVRKGVTAVIYTRRERLDLGDGMEEEELKLSVEISNAVTSIVRNFEIRPKYLIAKGGITSSDIGTKGLCVKRATVAGQVLPGIPVWKTGAESTFPFIPYIIFPGNVGSANALRDIVSNLES